MEGRRSARKRVRGHPIFLDSSSSQACQDSLSHWCAFSASAPSIDQALFLSHLNSKTLSDFYASPHSASPSQSRPVQRGLCDLSTKCKTYERVRVSQCYKVTLIGGSCRRSATRVRIGEPKQIVSITEIQKYYIP